MTTTGSLYHIEREKAIREFESKFIAVLLEKHHGNKAQVCREAGIQRTTLYRLLRRHQSAPGTQIIDLMEALRESIRNAPAKAQKV